MKSPCLDQGDGTPCFLAGADKNNDICKTCEDRINYINNIGKCPGSAMAMEVTDKKETEKRKEKRENKGDKIQKLIDVILLEEGLDRSDLTKPDARGKYRRAKVKICQGLRELKLKHKDIAAATGISLGSVGNYMHEDVPYKKAAKKETEKRKEKIEKAPINTKEESCILTIDFTNNLVLFNKIKEIASQRVGEPENLILFWCYEMAYKGEHV